MSKGGMIILLGLILASVPFLGIPTVYKTAIAVVCGVVVAALGLLVREERKWFMRALTGDHQHDAYTENGILATKGMTSSADSYARAESA